ncbi:MAG: CU044_5270 family protein [Trebonia sp.]
MNEIDDMETVRELRDAVPWPSPARLGDGRARLVASAAADMERQAFRTRRFLPRGGTPRRMVALASAAAVAAGIVGYAISARTAPPARPAVASSPAAGHADATTPGVTQAVLAAKVLSAAASHVAMSGVTKEPRPGQWIYSKSVDYQPGQRPASQVAENWITFDGASSAYYQGRQFIVHKSPVASPGPTVSPWAAWDATATPKTAYDVLAALPAAPQALLAAIAGHIAKLPPGDISAGNPVAGAAPKTEAQREFDYLTQILWNAAGGVGGPPAAEAGAYRVLATLPGISVQPGITDAAGAPAIGVSDDGGYSQLLIDPASYQVTGLRWVSTGRGTGTAAETGKKAATGGATAPPKGTVIESVAYAQVAEVAAPGQK